MTLDGYENVWHFGYYFKYGTSDYLSYQIMDFKADKPDQLEAFAKLSADWFEKEFLTFDYVIRMLGSKETIATKSNRMRTVALAIANATDAQYHPLLIKKNRATKSLKMLGRASRQAELEGVFEINEPVDLNGKRVLVVDDVTTTGTSFEAIAATLKAAYPTVQLYGYALTRTHDYGDGGIKENEPDTVAIYKAALAAVQAAKKK